MSVRAIILGVVLGSLTVITLVGNALVMLAVGLDKSLHTKFNVFIFNLAVTDFAVGLTAMSFYTFDTVLGYWPFGEFMCGVWVFFDYGMTFASVFTVCAISIDRFWAITFPLHFKQHNTKRKVGIMIVGVWLLMLAVWLGPCVYDRMKWSTPQVCKYEPSKNKEFSIFVAAVGHHGAAVMFIVCYVKSFHVLRHKLKIMPLKRKSVSTTEASMTFAPGTTKTTFVSEPKGNSKDQKAMSQNQKDKLVKSILKKETKTFLMLSVVLLVFAVCWFPYHLVFTIDIIAPNWIPEDIYIFTFWLTYFNSTVNPLAYCLISHTYRKAFKKVLTCIYCCGRDE